jgi:flagellin-like protein
LKTNRRRSGISEFIAALIMIAITLVAGTAAFGWILSQAGTSEQSYGNSVAVGVNFLNERFTLVSQSYTTAGGGACGAGKCTDANFWLYNTGTVSFTLLSIQVKSITTPPDNNAINVVFTRAATGGNATIYINGVRTFCLTATGWNMGVVPLPSSQLSGTPFHFSMPAACGVLPQIYLFDGTTYTISLTGLYGNIVTESITPNG